MLETAIKAAKEGAKVLMQHYGRVSESYKPEHVDAEHHVECQPAEYFDPAHAVTEADPAAEAAIRKIIKDRFPDHSIKGEELGEENKGSEYLWSIDPLDGTGNFARGMPLFGISIGVLKNDEPIVGVLNFPALDLIVSAEKSKGAYANGQRISVSGRELKKALYFGRGFYFGKWWTEMKVAEKVGNLKIIDTSAYEFAQIARGNGELYICPTVLHDVAAGVVITREAGGRVTDYDGTEWTPKSKGTVASNGIIHDKVIDLIEELKKR